MTFDEDFWKNVVANIVAVALMAVAAWIISLGGGGS